MLCFVLALVDRLRDTHPVVALCKVLYCSTVVTQLTVYAEDEPLLQDSPQVIQAPEQSHDNLPRCRYRGTDKLCGRWLSTGAVLIAGGGWWLMVAEGCRHCS